MGLNAWESTFHYALAQCIVDVYTTVNNPSYSYGTHMIEAVVDFRQIHAALTYNSFNTIEFFTHSINLLDT